MTKGPLSSVGTNIPANAQDIIQGGSISIHKIDRVLTLPENLAVTLPEVEGVSNIVDAAAVADLAETLTTVGDLTIFVPNNAAFEAIGSVLATVNLETLQAVLQYHAITGEVLFAEDVTNTTTPSLAGNLTLSVIDGAVFVNEARVIIPNIILSNGVAHVIDSWVSPFPTENATNRFCQGLESPCSRACRPSLALAIEPACRRLSRRFFHSSQSWATPTGTNHYAFGACSIDLWHCYCHWDTSISFRVGNELSARCCKRVWRKRCV
jgi:uncharacterized surface protein with fasciclin (FAS1) repeats